MGPVTVYVVLICRPCDRGSAWAAVYMRKDLAERAYGRVSPVSEVELCPDEGVGVLELVGAVA